MLVERATVDRGEDAGRRIGRQDYAEVVTPEAPVVINLIEPKFLAFFAATLSKVDFAVGEGCIAEKV